MAQVPLVWVRCLDISHSLGPRLTSPGLVTHGTPGCLAPGRRPMGPARQRAWLCVTCVPTTVPTAQPSADRWAPPAATPQDGASPGGHKQPDSRAPADQITDGSRTTAPRLSAGGRQIHSHAHLPRGPHPWTAGAAAPVLVPSVGVATATAPPGMAHEWLSGRGVKGTGARAGPESPMRWAGPRDTSRTCTSP